MNKRFVIHILNAPLYVTLIFGYILLADEGDDKLKERLILKNKLESIELQTQDQSQEKLGSSIGEKANYAKSRNLGGMMIWALSYDMVDGAQELIESINQYYLSNDLVDSKILPNDFNINIFPNPFNDQCVIKINTIKSIDAINIYSLDGSIVKTIMSENLNDSKNKFIWNGKEEKNQMKAGANSEFMKMEKYLKKLV